MYYLVGSTMNTFFEDELLGISNLYKNILCGTITGGLYKSTLGIVPCCVGAILGGSLIGTMTLLSNYLYKENYIAFEMKF
jgi:import inner membrane translocase subunit TIM23